MAGKGPLLNFPLRELESREQVLEAQRPAWRGLSDTEASALLPGYLEKGGGSSRLPLSPSLRYHIWNRQSAILNSPSSLRVLGGRNVSHGSLERETERAGGLSPSISEQSEDKMTICFPHITKKAF